MIIEPISIKDLETAETMLEYIKQIMRTYECVLVADIYDLFDMQSEYADNKYGWINMDGFTVQYDSVTGVTSMRFPMAIPLE